MEDSDPLNKHLNRCQDVYEHARNEGTWPWPDSSEREFDDKLDEQAVRAHVDSLPSESRTAIRHLVDVLRKLHKRLTDDGYELVDGTYRLRKPPIHELPGKPDNKDTQGDTALQF